MRSPLEIDIRFCATADFSAAALAGAETLLSRDERTRQARFVFTRDRRDFAAAHALLRQSLSRHLPIDAREWVFDATEHGKPFLPPHFGSDLTFSLSHTGGAVACAIAHGIEIGVDIESIGRPLDSIGIAARFFSARERDALGRCTQEERPLRFIELWTLKEAFLKAKGTGLSAPLDAFSFCIDDGDGLQFEPPLGEIAEGWRFALYAPSDCHRLALAYRRPGGAMPAASVDVWAEDGYREVGREEPLRVSTRPA